MALVVSTRAMFLFVFRPNRAGRRRDRGVGGGLGGGSDDFVAGGLPRQGVLGGRSPNRREAEVGEPDAAWVTLPSSSSVNCTATPATA